MTSPGSLLFNQRIGFTKAASESEPLLFFPHFRTNFVSFEAAFFTKILRRLHEVNT